MTKRKTKGLKKSKTSYEKDFNEIYKLVSEAKSDVFKQVNILLINTYWQVGKYISNKEGWGQSVVEDLADYIASQDSTLKGFSARNIWRMKQFYEAYKELSTVLTEIGWSSHLHILSKSKSDEERQFYLQLAATNNYSSRDLARLIDSSAYERTILADKKLSTVLTEFKKDKNNLFKDTYVFEFLGLPEIHKESDLRKGLVKHLKKFLLELGPDFSLIGEEYTLQVGMKDFRVDLLMHNRELNCLCAIELKVTEFQPEYLGKMQFYLEALDRDVKKPHENPSIGILICKTKDDEVVKYALNRNMSPTMIAEYETKLLNKDLLQKKLHEISENLLDQENSKK